MISFIIESESKLTVKSKQPCVLFHDMTVHRLWQNMRIDVTSIYRVSPKMQNWERFHLLYIRKIVRKAQNDSCSE